jgi:adenylosuccinate synthase
MINGIDYLTVTKLDVLDDLSEIKVCIGYTLKDPARNDEKFMFYDLGSVEPIYKTFKGWKQSTSGITRIDDLPEAAQEYVRFIGSFTGTRIALISTGPARGQTILLPPLAPKDSNVTV